MRTTRRHRPLVRSFCFIGQDRLVLPRLESPAFIVFTTLMICVLMSSIIVLGQCAGPSLIQECGSATIDDLLVALIREFIEPMQ